MIGKDIATASQLLADGKVVAIPTETVYGLAANALDIRAVSEIYSVKNRPHFNPLIVHVPSLDAAKKYVTHFPKAAEELARHFWPGSLSILLPKNEMIPDIITAGSPHVVLRVPNHPLTLQLLQSVPFPLAAPSANVSNTVSPTTANHVEHGLGDRIEYILDGGKCGVGVESTIVCIQEGEVVILREGGVSQEAIIHKTGLPILPHTPATIQSPGQLKRHYATHKPLYIVNSFDEFIRNNPQTTCSILYYEKPKDTLNVTSYFLSETYHLGEIANQLFSILRIADADSSDCILIQPIKPIGIGRAIQDRIQRAATV